MYVFPLKYSVDLVSIFFFLKTRVNEGVKSLFYHCSGRCMQFKIKPPQKKHKKNNNGQTIKCSIMQSVCERVSETYVVLL